jgi:hypothetical protein
MRKSAALGVWVLAVATLSRGAHAAGGPDPVTVESAPEASSRSPSDFRNVVADQFAYGAPMGSPGTLRSGFFTDRLSGSNDLSASLSLLYGAAVTRDLGARASAGSPFPDRGGTIARLWSGAEWQLSRRWALIPVVSGSIPSTTQTSINVPYPDANGTPTAVPGDLRIKASSVGGELSAEYDTLDAGRVEFVLTFTGGFTNFWITQGLTKLQLTSNMDMAVTTVTTAALKSQCQASPCSQQIQDLLAKPSASVAQVYGEADVTGIIRHTDVGFSGTGYAYSQDPGQIGFFGVAGFARGPSSGDGYPAAPLLFQVWGHAQQKLGAWRLSGNASYGRYVDAEGSSESVSLKVAYAASSRIRLWATGTLQRDDLTSLGVVDTVVTAIGLRWVY